MPPSFPNYGVTSILKNTHVPLGPWRAPSHSQNVFFIESFIDEMAHATGKDPVALRRELLAHRSGFQQVLDVLVENGDWGEPMPRGKGRGVAIHESYDSIVGMIAEVAVANGEVKVERVVIACDCGVVVNPRGVETQLRRRHDLRAIGRAVRRDHGQNGRVEQGNFDTYPVVRFKDAPKTEVYITPTPGKKWGGVGEPGATCTQMLGLLLRGSEDKVTRDGVNPPTGPWGACPRIAPRIRNDLSARAAPLSRWRVSRISRTKRPKARLSA